MRVIPLILGLFLPACGQPGAAGLPAAAPIDFAALHRPSSPNTALAAPSGFQPAPDLVTRTYGLPAPELYALANRVAAAQKRTFPQAAFPQAAFEGRLQAQYVVRSALLNFPDLVTIQVDPAGPAASTLILWSRSVYGYSDLGVNRNRLVAWLAALDAALPANSKGTP